MKALGVHEATEHRRHVMRSQAQIIALTLVAAVVATRTTPAQQKSSEDATIQSHSITLLAGQEAVQGDLKVSEEVASKLKRLADEFRKAADNVYKELGIKTLNPNTMTEEQRKKYGEQVKTVNAQFGPKLRELLTPDQIERLEQIQFQYRMHLLSAPRAFRNLNVASELELTDDQDEAFRLLSIEHSMKLGEGLRGKQGSERSEFRETLRQDYTKKAIERLMPAQKVKLDKLQGAPFDAAKLERN
jgi:hypothetical protein